MSLLNEKVYKYKYHKRCSVCLFCRRHPDVKKVIVNLKLFNPNGPSIDEAIRHYKLPLKKTSIWNHCQKHMSVVETKVINRAINDREPIKNLGVDVVGNAQAAHESTLDEFIAQFDSAVRNKELKMTVKDGLSAIKIKADIQKADKDRKKDILKLMVGADEQRRPAERTQA